MKCPVEARCIICHYTFCCASCRWKHEEATHGLKYDCCLCRGQRYLCRPEHLDNKDFIKHITEKHLPLQCRKCQQLFTNMEDLINIDKCQSITELIDQPQVRKDPTEIEARFDSIYEKTIAINDNENIEAIISVYKNNRTAVITPIVRKKTLVDYESSEDSEYDSPKPTANMHTPHPKMAPKTPKLKKQRAATPHAKKFINLMRQRVIEEYEKEEECKIEKDLDDSPVGSKTTPVRKEDGLTAQPSKGMTTPTSHLPDRCLKLAQAVTTSTPTHPAAGAWAMFPEQGADSPLSEIEGTTGESPAQSSCDPSKSESQPKLKSIIVTASRLRLGSQDSSEKQVTFQDSNNTDGSVKSKRVKFADDTVFHQENKVKRVFRKPKRMLTPGPQKPGRYCFNPRFQALINRFENQGITLARTPVNSNRDREQESTPPVGEHANIPARAINFKESVDSPAVSAVTEKESNELFRTCVDSPAPSQPLQTAISALTTNIAGSLQNCLSSALRANEEETEIQFKFVITKRKAVLRKIPGEGENCNEIVEAYDANKENIWSSVARAVKNVFWGEQGMSLATTTPLTRPPNESRSSSGCKRKSDDLSDNELSPLNHKRHKYSGRLRGRPPLPRSGGVARLRGSMSAEQHSLLKEMPADGAANQSF
ncbi:unnamed protein product [Plutella xylostella]|uniref:(diamondback moth) hypothetical protein n=1 Tax=Plutella xylostella TaxID=51655 RepID=A0A8S4G757_PLUXY|nr:unnamed protein product [Plutella xylostella]